MEPTEPDRTAPTDDAAASRPGPDPRSADPRNPDPRNPDAHGLDPRDRAQHGPDTHGPDPRDRAQRGPDPRDRDAAGRPRNARPRDGLGRPLPKGMPGVPTTPDDLVLPPGEALREAQRLLDQGRPFHAHEVLEAAWKAAEQPEREFWRGMAQLAVGLTHARRGNAEGAARLLLRAADRIEAYAAAPPHGVPVAALTAWARDAAHVIGHNDGDDLPARVLTPTLVGRAPDPR